MSDVLLVLSEGDYRALRRILEASQLPESHHVRKVVDDAARKVRDVELPKLPDLTIQPMAN